MIIVLLVIGTVVLTAGVPLAVYFLPARFLFPCPPPGRDVLPMRGIGSKRDKEQQ